MPLISPSFLDLYAMGSLYISVVYGATLATVTVLRNFVRGFAIELHTLHFANVNDS